MEMKGGRAVLFNKTGQQNICKKMDTSVLISVWKCQEDADSLISCHEKCLDDEKKSVCVLGFDSFMQLQTSVERVE